MNENRTILLVDDSPEAIFFLRTAFARVDYNCPLQEALDGEQAIAYLAGDGRFSDRKAFPLPILVLLDLKMPKKDGFEVLTWARTQPALHHMPIYILTASTQPADIQRAFDLGAKNFLVKPCGLHASMDLVRTLRDWVSISNFPEPELEPDQRHHPSSASSSPPVFHY